MNASALASALNRALSNDVYFVVEASEDGDVAILSDIRFVEYKTSYGRTWPPCTRAEALERVKDAVNDDHVFRVFRINFDSRAIDDVTLDFVAALEGQGNAPALQSAVPAVAVRKTSGLDAGRVIHAALIAIAIVTTSVAAFGFKGALVDLERHYAAVDRV